MTKETKETSIETMTGQNIHVQKEGMQQKMIVGLDKDSPKIYHQKVRLFMDLPCLRCWHDNQVLPIFQLRRIPAQVGICPLRAKSETRLKRLPTDTNKEQYLITSYSHEQGRKHLHKRCYAPTDGRTDRREDIPSYRGAS